MLAGTICKAPETRHTPAGIPLTRFTIEHRSCQQEADMEREAYCKIIVIAAGKKMAKQVECLSEGLSVVVSGFISRADNRQGSAKIVLHAQQIQPES